MQSINSLRDGPQRAERVGQIWSATPQSIFKAGLSAVLWDSIKRKDRRSEMTTGRPTCQTRNKAPRMRPDPKIKRFQNIKLFVLRHLCARSFSMPQPRELGMLSTTLRAPEPSSPSADDTNQPFPFAWGFYTAQGSTEEGTDFDSQGLFGTQPSRSLCINSADAAANLKSFSLTFPWDPAKFP